MRPLILLLITLLCASPAAASRDLRVAVISDINGRYGSTSYHQRLGSAIQRIIALQPDLVISTGDMVAGQRAHPPLQTRELEAMWRSFRSTVHAPLERANIPLVMTPGNHDASAYPGFAHERAMYADYQHRHPPLLSPEPGGNFPFYFSMVRGRLKLVSLDATRTGALEPAQRRWLAETLGRGSAGGAANTDITLVFGHLPLQAIARGRERDVISDPQLEALLREGRVSAYLSGHHHAFYPGHRSGVTMLSMGNLGGNQRALIGTDQRTGFSFTILDFDESGQMQVSAFLGPDFDKTLNTNQLPRALGTGSQRLQRRDLLPPAVDAPTPRSAGP
ncbi:metallophosphoesterase [Pseudohalioglobus sediminis]|uniref:Metallophosphoesterase n=1 Tax=Pseudohalioglobus sediminis TaxID=2606449 RepID=A0A5B0WYB2_9GAMM|nr:metallophosphoesterase [Pseudohalioglobus sediminis]KAA1192013.1 metallophosphoesterase [Pseudohalioglobus sediminis]